jgi:signal transduction histidine kinase
MLAAKPELSSRFSLNCDEDRYAGLFRHAGDAMLLVDGTGGHGIIVDLNPAAVHLFRADSAHSAPFPLQAFCSSRQTGGRDSAALADEYSRRAADGETLRYPWRFLRQDQTEFDADVTLSRIGNSENDLQLAIVREITKDVGVAEAQSLLRQRTAQLDSVAAELDAFSYTVSHDLRAAISGIAACSQIVMNDFAAGMNEEARRWLGHIHEDSVQLDRLTEGLLELSRVSRRTMDPASLDLTSIARDIVREFTAEERRSLKFIVSEGLEADGDPELVRMLLRHLLDNARKFTRNAADGRIEFGRLPRNTCDREAIFFIRDNGVGFDMASAGRLFVPFQRLHRDPELGGNGIGLAVVRRIVHRHGGEIRVEGKPGGGATFFFTLDGTCGK